MNKTVRFPDVDGIAALGICESLMLALTEAKILSDREVRDLLSDVAAAHQCAIATSESPDRHQAVIAIVERILAGKNGVRG